MLMNYPYGRIFLGDLGAYSLGLIVSMLTIILFGRHPEISP
jgi:UDP-N-acetylmuramyl pentapeptide phosphotransferase/UDP-N-acetylglucosamine-1-phosphate transferase